MDLVELEDPKPIGPDWVVLRSRLTGICGSDSKQVFMENAEDEIARTPQHVAEAVRATLYQTAHAWEESSTHARIRPP